MEIEMLHSFHGDKKKKLDTETATQRAMTAEAIAHLKKEGIALFLEQGKDAFPIEGYDPETDRLIVQVPYTRGQLRMGVKSKKKIVKARAEKEGRKVTGVAPVRGG